MRAEFDFYCADHNNFLSFLSHPSTNIAKFKDVLSSGASGNGLDSSIGLSDDMAVATKPAAFPAVVASGKSLSSFYKEQYVHK